ncbi:hypothetical protein EUA06_10570 [Nocardioides glacieisoli]|uniref:Polysaccharide chain length determinant N-terminal domain-containing protein n=1 Tax=Nocardioides glacieisoli TaxID=1168730 RepID=A0A4Q2RS50_9ACTN|nr:hypothetical protein [Nocardioides glacieisoli]RYB90724.1 hypothetical protein EUA06_10570 [Nocardioides glacieisoli]
MELGSSLRLLLRQWIVVVLGGLLTAGAAAYLYTSTPPTYRATAQLLLLLPSTAGDPEQRNSAFLYLPNELNILARVVASVPSSRDFAVDLADRGLTSSYEVGVEPTSPVINVGAEGDDPVNVLATRDGLVEAVGDELARVQREERVPTDQTARIRVFAAETTPVELGGSGLRGVIAVLAAGGLLTLLTAFATDWLAEVRRRRRVTSTSRTSPPLTSPPPTSPPTTAPVAARASSGPVDQRPVLAATSPAPRNGSAPGKRPPAKGAPRKRTPSKKGSPRASKQAPAEREPGDRAPSVGDGAFASARGADRP